MQRRRQCFISLRHTRRADFPDGFSADSPSCVGYLPLIRLCDSLKFKAHSKDYKHAEAQDQKHMHAFLKGRSHQIAMLKSDKLAN